MFNNYYKDKTVLVTGHTGFKGSWLAIWLKSLGANVIGFALPPNTDPNNFDQSNLKEKIVHIEGDIRNPKGLLSVFDKHKPEIVFHLAAQPIVRLSYEEPHTTYETNVMGLINLCEAIKSTSSVKSIVNVTSDKCYENNEWVWGYRETDPVGGKDPYSSSKACAEIITNAYRHSFFQKNNIAVASARAGNIVGGGDWSLDRIIPDFIKAMTKNESLYLRNPNAIRPWQYVLEPLSGYLLLGSLIHTDQNKYSSAWNFGPNISQNLPVKELVEQMINYWGSGDWKLDPDAINQPHEAQMLTLDCNKAHQILKWIPVLSVEDTFKKTVEWYKNFYGNKTNAFELCIKQINEYVELARKKRVEWSN
ncbi:MAG: CDP-glucose 4,6-dehydratase [Candidatus Kariarchaeaceae archaeon]|jgi:CDP-glucose 4,6-dehydratase